MGSAWEEPIGPRHSKRGRGGDRWSGTSMDEVHVHVNSTAWNVSVMLVQECLVWVYVECSASVVMRRGTQ